MEVPYNKGEDVIPIAKSARHLGVDRFPDSLTPDAHIEDRISTGRKTAHSMMGAGMHGVNGISPRITTNLYKCVCAVCLLASSVLSSELLS
jgi:hypothetical protein